MDTTGQKNGSTMRPSEGSATMLEHAGRMEHAALVVRQPEKIKSLLVVLGDIERISERITEDASQDLGTGGGSSGTQGAQAQGGSQTSQRKQALYSLPTTTVMRERLVKHLHMEIRHLEREARRITSAAGKGSAYALTQIYAKIRKIQTLITEILEAAKELVERLYVRLFIDHQQLV